MDTGCTDEGNREHALKQRDSVVNKGLGVFDRHRLRYMGTLSTDFSAPELQKWNSTLLKKKRKEKKATQGQFWSVFSESQ